MATFIRSFIPDGEEWTPHKNRPINIELVQEIVQRTVTVMSKEPHKEYAIEFKFISGNETNWRYTENQKSERDFDYNYIIHNKFNVIKNTNKI